MRRSEKQAIFGFPNKTYSVLGFFSSLLTSVTAGSVFSLTGIVLTGARDCNMQQRRQYPSFSEFRANGKVTYLELLQLPVFAQLYLHPWPLLSPETHVDPKRGLQRLFFSLLLVFLFHRC